MKFNDEEFRVLLARRNWSVEEFARRSGITSKTIRSWASGGTFQSSNLNQVARTLGVSSLDLVAVEDEPAPLMDAPVAA